MTDQKTIEDWANEAYPDMLGISQGSYRTAYVQGAAKQKELCDEREKLLRSVIDELVKLSKDAMSNVDCDYRCNGFGNCDCGVEKIHLEFIDKIKSIEQKLKDLK